MHYSVVLFTVYLFSLRNHYQKFENGFDINSDWLIIMYNMIPNERPMEGLPYDESKHGLITKYSVGFIEVI